MVTATLLTPGLVSAKKVAATLTAVEVDPTPSSACGPAHGECGDASHITLRAALAPHTSHYLWVLPAPCRVADEGGKAFVLVGMVVPRNARAGRIPVIAMYVEEAWEGRVLPLRLPFPWTSAMVPGSSVLFAGLDEHGDLDALPPRSASLWLTTNRHETVVPTLERELREKSAAAPPSDAFLAQATALHALIGPSLQVNPSHEAAARRREDQSASRIAKRPELAHSLRRLGSDFDQDEEKYSALDNTDISDTDGSSSTSSASSCSETGSDSDASSLGSSQSDDEGDDTSDVDESDVEDDDGDDSDGESDEGDGGDEEGGADSTDDAVGLADDEDCGGGSGGGGGGGGGGTFGRSRKRAPRSGAKVLESRRRGASHK